MSEKLNKRFLVCVGVATFLLTGSLSLSAEQPAQQLSKNTCAKPRKTPTQPYFQGLKKVNVSFEIDGAKYGNAIACHGREDWCATKSAPGDGRPDYLQKYPDELKKWYALYPAQLRPDVFFPRIVNRAQRDLSRWVERTDQCVIPSVSVFYRHSDYPMSSDDINKEAQVPDSLTVSIKIDIVDNGVPPMAVVSHRFFRPNAGESQFHFGRPVVTAFPLGASADEVDKTLKYFIDHLPFLLFAQESQ